MLNSTMMSWVTELTSSVSGTVERQGEREREGEMERWRERERRGGRERDEGRGRDVERGREGEREKLHSSCPVPTRWPPSSHGSGVLFWRCDRVTVTSACDPARLLVEECHRP